jgi:hypothetical protein
LRLSQSIQSISDRLNLEPKKNSTEIAIHGAAEREVRHT